MPEKKANAHTMKAASESLQSHVYERGATMLELLMFALEQFFARTDLQFPLFCALVLFVLLFQAKKEQWIPLYACRLLKWMGAALITAWIMNAALQGWARWLLWAIVIAFWIGAGRILFVTHQSVERQLKHVIRYSNEDNVDCDCVRAWNHLNELPPSRMTKKQRKQYTKYRLYLQMKLGNYSGAEEELNRTAETDPVYYHFLKHIQWNAMGEIQLAAGEIQLADEGSNADTEPMTKLQILIDRGVSYYNQGIYKTAEEYYEKALSYGSDIHLESKELWFTIYYNRLFNRCKQTKGLSLADFDADFSALEAHLEQDNPLDRLRMFKLKLDLMNEMEAPFEKVNELVRDFFRLLNQLEIDDSGESDVSMRIRCLYVIQFVRVIWAHHLDPAIVLPTLRANWADFQALPMPERYDCLKELNLFFEDLHGNIVEDYQDIREYVFCYMSNQAIRDLEKHENQLPSVAVFRRAYDRKEIAALMKRNHAAYRWDAFLAEMENAEILYGENGLWIDNLMCNMAVMDEACHPLNMDEHHNVIQTEEMSKRLLAIEEVLPKLRRAPLLSEIYVRLGFYCIHMCEYERCKLYYEKYRSESHTLPIRHFTSWMWRYYMEVCFVVRALYFLDAVERVRMSPDLKSESGLVQEWFRRCPEGDGGFLSFLLGRFLGYDKVVALKTRLWRGDREGTSSGDPNNDVISSWTWLVVPDFHLEIDPGYPRYQMDENHERIFWEMGQHPFETRESRFLRGVRSIRDSSGNEVTAYSVDCSTMWEKLRQSTPGTPATSAANNSKETTSRGDALDRVEQLILANVSPHCPKMQEIEALYRKTMMPDAL